MEECDTLLIVGSSFPYVEFYPKAGQAQAVQIDLDPQRISLRYQVEVGLVGDSRRTLQGLSPSLRHKDERGFLQKAQEGMRDRWKLMEEQGTQTSKPMKPQVVAWELGKRLRNDAILAADSGTNTTWWARHIPARGEQMHTVSGTLASMAAVSRTPSPPSWRTPNGKSWRSLAMAATPCSWRRWPRRSRYGLPIKVIVVKNNYLGQIKWEQMAFLGNPEYEVRSSVDRLRTRGGSLRRARIDNRGPDGLRSRS